ncbi:MAG: hypothetical protein OZ913_07090 [Ignavibacteriaceae bacterium]|nr:hypothetical protein [Ignavibacteriaceae bacterium]
MCKMINASKVLEIGTLTGYSGLCIMRALPGIGKLITVDLLKKHTDTAKSFFRKAGLEKISLQLVPVELIT